MIGKQMKGIHHLGRCLDSKPRYIIFEDNCGSYRLGQAIKVNYGVEDSILLFNNTYCFDEIDFSIYKGNGVENAISRLKSSWKYCLLIQNCKSIYLCRKFSDILPIIWLLPNDFIESYNKFYKENKKHFQIIEEKNSLKKENNFLMYVYSLCNGSKNYFFWVIKLYFNYGISLKLIKRALHFAENYSQLIKQLKQGTITAYNDYYSILDLLDECTILRKNKRIKDVINSFNTAQKKILKDMTLTEHEKNLISSFAKLSLTKRTNFIRKMSTANDSKEILRQMSFIVQTSFEWNKESLIDYVTNNEFIHAEIITNTGDIVLLKVFDYDSIKWLGKNTNWCISKNKSYWNQYLTNKGTNQYVLFDFSKVEDDKTSIVGFTTSVNSGIVHAHDFINNNIMPQEENNRFESFVKLNKNDTKDIFNLLEEDNINIDDIVSYDKLPYEWNKKSFLAYLEKCVGKDSYFILQDLNDKLCVAVQNERIYNFLGSKYTNNLSEKNLSKKHILFADFSLNEKSKNRLLFTFINNNRIGQIEEPNALFNVCFQPVNETFDYKLIEFGLPYDVISRRDDINSQLTNALFLLDVQVLRLLFEKRCLLDYFRTKMISKNTKDIIANQIQMSIMDYKTLDLLLPFYENGMTLDEVVGTEEASVLIKNIYNILVRCSEVYGGTLCVPTYKELQMFNDYKLNNFDKSMYIGFFEALKFIIEKENNISVFHDIINELNHKYDSADNLPHYIMYLISKKLDDKDVNKTKFLLIRHAVINDDKEILENLLNVKNLSVHKCIEKLMKKEGLNIKNLTYSYSK